MSKVQEASSILRVGFALSKYPHLNSVYLEIFIIGNQYVKVMERAKTGGPLQALKHKVFCLNWFPEYA